MGTDLEPFGKELRDVRQAPVAVAVLFMLGFGSGWTAGKVFYAERIEVLQQRLSAATEGSPVPSSPGRHITWVSAVLLGITGVLALTCVIIAVSSRRHRRENKLLVSHVDTLQESLGALSKEKKHLAGERERILNERDVAVTALNDKKREYAIETLARCSRLRFEGGVVPNVIIRYGSYGYDDDLAFRIKALFDEHVKWPVTLDASNRTALPRAEEFKVVFDVGMTVMTYGDLVHAFADGNLLGVTVGVRQGFDREDSQNLIVMVLPSAA